MSGHDVPIDYKSKIRVAWLTLIVSVALFVAKYWAYTITDSHAVFSDAMEGIVNIVTSALGIWVIHWAAQPADKDHPYGHGKAELLSSAFEGGLIAFAAVMIVIESVQSLIEPHPLKQLDSGLLIVLVAGVINLVLAIFLKKRGNSFNSPALLASGQHLLSDFMTSAAVIFGLILVKVTGFVWLDAASAILISIHLFIVGFTVVRDSISGLMDENNPELLAEWQKLINGNPFPGIIQIHHLRILKSGSFHHIDAHVVVPEFWTINEAHQSTSEFEHQLLSKYKFDGEFHFHIDPCRQVYCQFCDLEDCHIRKQKFETKKFLSIEELTELKEPDGV